MSVTLSKILQLPVFQGAAIVAGESGQGNKVNGIAMLEAPDSIQWILENDLVLTNAYFLNSATDKIEDILHLLSEKGCAGMAIKFKRYMSSAPDIMLKLGDRLSFPIVSLPYDAVPTEMIKNVVYEIIQDAFPKSEASFKDTFIKELLFSDFDRDAVARKAQIVGWARDYCPVVLLIWPHDKRRLSEIHDICLQNDSDSCNSYLMHDNYIITVVDSTKSENRLELASEVAQKLKWDILCMCNYNDFHIGIGRCCDDLANLSNSYYEAKTAMEISYFNGDTKIICKFEELGIGRILFDIKNRTELKLFYDETVGRIVKFDNEHKTEYFKTIETFMDKGCSIKHTAEVMYVHSNTIRYRLDKVRELIGIDFANETNRLNFMVGIMIEKFYRFQRDNR